MKTSETRNLRILEFVSYGLALFSLMALGLRIAKMELTEKELFFGILLLLTFTSVITLGGISMSIRREITDLRRELKKNS